MRGDEGAGGCPDAVSCGGLAIGVIDGVAVGGVGGDDPDASEAFGGDVFCEAVDLVKGEEAHDEGVAARECPIGGEGEHVDAGVAGDRFCGADGIGEERAED